VSRTWDRAAERLQIAVDQGGSLCEPFVEAFPIAGAAISTIGGPLAAATICSSGQTALRLDEVQLDLGEGPCWDAVTLARAVSSPDLASPAETRWPAFREALRGTGVAAVFALPLRIGQVKVGAVDLYSDRPGPLSDDDLRDAASLAGLAVHEVFRRAIEAASAPGSEGDLSRAVVHQATGMIIAQLDIDPEAAALVLRGRAFSTGLSVREIAQAVVDRRLDFSRSDGEGAP
jgi:hypothetical protein